MIRFFYLLPIIVLLGCSDASFKKSIDHTKLFNSDWEFVKDIDEELTFDELTDKESNLIWETVSLPHTANIEPLVIDGQQWQGTSYYRKYFNLDSELSGKHIAIKFEAVMHEAEVYLNGEKVYYNAGGYLPFVVDISNSVNFGEENILLLKVNNEDNPEIPPGKPIADLDFNYYGGIYRDAYLIIKDQLRISDPILANRTAAGGVFVHFKNVSNDEATVVVQTDIENGRSENSSATLNVILRDLNGKQVSNKESKIQINQLSNSIQIDELKVKTPQLWSPNSPILYTLDVQLFDESGFIDSYQQKIGIRTFGFDENNQFILNGERVYLRGTNRHQDYPYIGYALSNNAQFRDAYKIKKAGFNFVRTAHYPPDPAFLEACDELGLLFMDAIPGWQFFGNELFQERALADVRKMVRRDRNHPSVIIWEASLNESGMPEEFMELADSVVKEELPIQNVYTSGWLDYAYDIFIPARQHSKPPLYWSDYGKNKPLFIAEYGDWEYYAQNAGFNQTAFENLKEEERNSRQLRSNGQRRLTQQALNFQEAHNSNLKGNSFGDANWVMYDYNRGYAPDLEASGVQDIFRIPKFVNYFYQSQVDPDLTNDGSEFYEPMVYIANYWSDPSFTEVKVFSNADEVALVLNGEEISRKTPDSDRVSSHLKHPPFTFQLDSFTPGKLVANAYFDGEILATHKSVTSGEPSKIFMAIDLSGKEVQSNTNDVVFVYANITDENGNIVFNSKNEISFSIEGDGELIGQNPINSEAGTATILLRAGKTPDNIKITAVSNGLEVGSIQIKSN